MEDVVRLRDGVDGGGAKFIIAKRQDKYVAIAAIFHNKKEIQVYVKPEFRRLGIGSLLVNEIVKNENRLLIKANYGIDEEASKKFFSTLKIPTIEYDIFTPEVITEIRNLFGELSDRDFYTKPGVIPALVRMSRLTAHRKENYISQEEFEQGVMAVKEDLKKTLLISGIEIQNKKKITRRYHKDGTTPDDGEIFVFGSNLAGRHGKGAASLAMALGAAYGNPRGLQGKTYAIPVKTKNIITMAAADVAREIRGFVQFTYDRPDLSFFVTAVGCGLAGFKHHEIAPLFKLAMNCSFPEQWRPYLEEE